MFRPKTFHLKRFALDGSLERIARMHRPKRNLNELMKYAKLERMFRVMKPYLEAITG